METETETEYRKVERLIAGDTWDEITFQCLKIGHTFRMFEADGKPVFDNCSETEFLAESDAYDSDGVWTIKVKVG